MLTMECAIAIAWGPIDTVWAASSTSVAVFSDWEVDAPVDWERVSALPLFPVDV